MNRWRAALAIGVAGLAAPAVAAPPAHRIGARPDVAVWACTPMWKVRPGMPVPESGDPVVRLSAARNEYESVQIVLTPERDLREVAVTAGDLSGAGGIIHAGNLRIEWVEYVNVTRPTHGQGEPGWWPDPLAPYEGPRAEVPAGRHQPIWVTIYVPAEAAAGEYTGTLAIGWAGESPVRVPIALRVRDFTLPEECSTPTAYNVYVNNDWHRLKTPDEQRAVYDLYLAAAARHRISPFSPMAQHPWREPPGGGTPDFSEFDRAARRYLDGFHFNAFNVDLPLGFGGQASFPPEYRERFGRAIRPVLEHLRERGWLRKAYAYWMDEPPKERYAWVKEGMATLRDHAPGVRRVLTMCVERAPMPEFHGLLDLWCPVMSLYDPEAAPARQKLGEKVWWYVCTGPGAPWPNNFIDHAAVTHRIRYWIMEKYNVEGDLYWSSTYWTYKNPWEDPQSYVNRPEGKDPDQVWGNGDGYLFYPPTRQPPAEAVVKGPCGSIRLALIRDGLEDREYFRAYERRAADGRALARAREVIDRLVTDFTRYERDPEKIEAARERLAEMVERED